MNIRCSNRCAKPVRPVFSRAEPTWYHMFVDTSGTAWSSCRITVRPFGSVNCVYGTSIFCCASAGVATARAATVSKAAIFIEADSTAIRTALHRQQRSHELDAVPEVLHPDVLVEAVLVVVVVGDGDDDRRRPEGPFEDVERHAGAHVRNLN